MRVLGDDHRAVGPWDPHLAPSDLELGLRHMMLTRVYDDRMQRAQRQGRISFYMKSTGEEAVSVAAGMALRPTDMLFPAYRNQGLQMVRGQKLVDLMCQLLSNTRDMCKGRQLPVMYHSKEARLFSISGNLATQFPQAVGWAMAAAIKSEDDIAATWLGDGSTAEADFHYALVFAQVIARRSFSMSSTTSGRYPRSRASRRRSRSRSRRAAPATESRAFASTATISSRCMRSRSGRPSVRAWAPGRHSIELVTYRAAPAFHQRRSVALSAERRSTSRGRSAIRSSG